MAKYKNCVLKNIKITSWGDEWVEGEGYEMNNEWYTKQLGWKFHEVSPVEFVFKT